MAFLTCEQLNFKAISEHLTFLLSILATSYFNDHLPLVCRFEISNNSGEPRFITCVFTIPAVVTYNSFWYRSGRSGWGRNFDMTANLITELHEIKFDQYLVNWWEIIIEGTCFVGLIDCRRNPFTLVSSWQCINDSHDGASKKVTLHATYYIPHTMNFEVILSSANCLFIWGQECWT